jgi:hypothetical protein
MGAGRPKTTSRGAACVPIHDYDYAAEREWGEKSKPSPDHGHIAITPEELFDIGRYSQLDAIWKNHRNTRNTRLQIDKPVLKQ